MIDGPRLKRPDGAAEAVRRNNAAARAKAKVILLAGLSDESTRALRDYFPAKRTFRVNGQNIAGLEAKMAFRSAPLRWGRDQIGIGLLKALRQRSAIDFVDEPSPVEFVPGRSPHLVVCEQGDPMAEVIAANYAYSLSAGLQLIPAVSEDETESILESLYGLYANRDRSPTDLLTQLQQRIRELCPGVVVPSGGSVTFISSGLPFGFGFPEAPSTHMFTYPDLGIAMVNGFSAGHNGSPSVEVAILVDPGTTEAPEIAAAAQSLSHRSIFVRGYSGAGANVRDIGQAIDHFPYDLLVIATHCGDASGYRWTYNFTDSEGIDRTLVVDLAIGIGQTDDPEMLDVMQFERFVSLDGVNWNDRESKRQLYVGKAIIDYIALTHKDQPLEPLKKEHIDRVIGSAALKMSDDNYIPVPRTLAAEGTPIILNNACGSWHRLAKNFTFGNARAYIGTLFEVSDVEASEVAKRLLDKHFGQMLPHALWSTQNEVYGSGGVRRPYVITGVYTQRLHGSSRDVPEEIIKKLTRSLARWTEMVTTAESDEQRKRTREIVRYYQRELGRFRTAWGRPT